MHGLAAGAVDEVKVDDFVAGDKSEGAQDGVDAGGGVRDEDDFGGGDVEVGCEGCAGFVEEGGVCDADELVGALFGGELESGEGGADGGWVCPEGAWWGVM